MGLTHCYLTMKLAIFTLLAFVSVCNGFSFHHDRIWPSDQRSDPMEKQPGTGNDYGLSLRGNVTGGEDYHISPISTGVDYSQQILAPDYYVPIEGEDDYDPYEYVDE